MEPAESALLAPAILIDAGDEPWPRIQPILDRCMDELPERGVLELHTNAPGVAAAAAAWCARRTDAPVDGSGAGVLRVRKVTPTPLQEHR